MHEIYAPITQPIQWDRRSLNTAEGPARTELGPKEADPGDQLRRLKKPVDAVTRRKPGASFSRELDRAERSEAGEVSTESD